MTETMQAPDAPTEMTDEQYQNYCINLGQSLDILLMGHPPGIVLDVAVSHVFRAVGYHALETGDDSIVSMLEQRCKDLREEMARRATQ